VVISRPTATDDRPSQAERSISLSERTLLLGPSNVGKTRNTARALETYVEIHDPDGVVVLEFAPVLERDGVLLGGRLDRFVSIPDAVWTGVLDAHAPRVEADETVDATELARINARHAAEVFQAAPSDPKAVFINDATIPFQHECSAPELLLAYCEPADCVVANAFESDELGVDDPVSREERTALETLRSWADRTITLE
jgi:hypothetical protein